MKTLALTILSLIFMTSALAQTGRIINLNVVGNEYVMEKVYVKNNDNTIHYFPIKKKKEIVGYEVHYNEEIENKDLEKLGLNNEYNYSNYEMFSSEESDKLLADVSQILSKKFNNSITAEPAKKPGKAMMGNMGSNVGGNNKYSFSLPNVKLKKTEAVADEYYEIKMTMLSGGESTDGKNKLGSLSFSVKVAIKAYKKDGTLLWEKEGESIDFASVFNQDDIQVSKKANFLKVKRTPRLTHQYTKEPIGDYTSLSKEEAYKCFMIALAEVLEK
jgi:hypothetical protein